MQENLMPDKNKNKQLPGILRFLIKLFQIILYIPIQVIFIPFAIIGLIAGIYKDMVISKKLGISYSAGQKDFKWEWKLTKGVLDQKETVDCPVKFLLSQII
jgi:hypothetical protein